MERSEVAAELTVCLLKPQSCDTSICSTQTTACAAHPISHLVMIGFDFKEGKSSCAPVMSDEAGETVIENPQLAWFRQHMEEGSMKVSQMFPRQP